MKGKARLKLPVKPKQRKHESDVDYAERVEAGREAREAQRAVHAAENGRIRPWELSNAQKEELDARFRSVLSVTDAVTVRRHKGRGPCGTSKGANHASS